MLIVTPIQNLTPDSQTQPLDTSNLKNEKE